MVYKQSTFDKDQTSRLRGMDFSLKPSYRGMLFCIIWTRLDPYRIQLDRFYTTNKELEKAIASKFLTPQKFAIEIEKIVAEEDLNYIDAILHYCEINNLEVDSIKKVVSKPLKERLKWDATRLNFMKKTSRAKLPL